MARFLIFTGRPQEGLEFVEKSMRLDPHEVADDLDTMADAHVCMGEYEKAATIAERAVLRYPDILTYFWNLTVSYAHLGRTQEAESAYEKMLSEFGGQKPDLAILMTFVTFKSKPCADIFADGLLKAGCPGQPSGYYKIYAENRLTGEEAKELISGHKLNLFYMNYPFWMDHSNDGKVNFEGFEQSYGGSWRIKDDMVCHSWERPDLIGLDDCFDLYRNPDSKPGSKKEYFAVFDHGIFPFSVEK
jgi:tetratricopeptide (TPR) repeat protein